jgi:hypothetical protein
VDAGDAGQPRLALAPTFPDVPVTRIVEQSTEPGVNAAVLREAVPSLSTVGQPRHSEPQPSSALESTTPARSAGSAAAPKEFFTRTVELLTGEGTAAADSQAILLREVQEWVAASPIEPPVAPAAPAMRDMARAGPVSPSRAAEATVIRENRPAEESARQQPLEQRFELSIGTIDVIIEEAEKPRATEPRPARAEKVAPAEERRFSRLSRGYL